MNEGDSIGTVTWMLDGILSHKKVGEKKTAGRP